MVSQEVVDGKSLLCYDSYMKTCVRCQSSKELSDFRKSSRSKDGYEAACKACRRAYDNQTYLISDDRRQAIRKSNENRRLALSKQVRAYLESHPCVDCGLSDPELLEFDHVRGTKVAGVGQLVSAVVSWSKIQAEIDKCEVRCLHCHRKRTISQLGWYASLV